jgi:aminotransferase EvaB
MSGMSPSSPGTHVPLNDLMRHHAPIAQELELAVRRVLARGWYVLGEENERFESAFAAYCGTRHAIGVANGTDAIELALRALGLRAGDTVITAANAGFYTTISALAIGARPVFADVDFLTHAINEPALTAALELHPAAKAVVVTHLYGRLAEIKSLAALCDAAGIPLIEDCAQAHGARIDGRRAGSFGTIGCFSFYPTKNLGALGDGGALTTDRDELAQRIRSLRQYGWDTKYHVQQTGGRNSRLDELQAAVLSAKLPRLDAWNARRRAIAERYTRAITNARVICPPIGGEDYVAHLYVIRCEDRDALRAHLAVRGIGTEIHYPVPDHRQAALRDDSLNLPVTEKLTAEILTLPCFPEMTAAEVERIVAAVNGW